MMYQLLNNETSQRKVVSCVTPCCIQLVEPKSHTICRIQLVRLIQKVTFRAHNDLSIPHGCVKYTCISVT